MQAMKDRELLDFIRDTVGELQRLGDRLEMLAPANGHDGGQTP